MPITAGFTVKDATPAFLRAIRALADRRVMVGVPSDEEQPHLAASGTAPSPNERTDDQGNTSPVTNALIGYVHENGEPSLGIPARPHLVPGVTNARERLVSRFQRAGQAVLRGDLDAADRYLNAAGIEAVSSVKRVIQEGIPPPLKPATIARRRVRSKGSSYRRQATTADDVTPLIDTAQYINSISYVVRKGKK